MHRRAQILISCCVLLTAAMAQPAAAQDGSGSPQELWKEFPLDPTPTAEGTESPDATPSSAEPRTPALDGSSTDDGVPASLFVIIGALALAGAGAVYSGVRRLVRTRERRVLLPVQTRPLDPVSPPDPGLWAEGEATTCQVSLRSGRFKSYFYATLRRGGPELARSPTFAVRNGDEGDAEGAPEALQALVDDLTARGWHKTATGRTPWDLHFERDASARPLEPADSR